MSDKNEFTQTTLLQASPVNTPVGQSNRNYLSNAATPSPVPSLNPPPHSGGGAGAGTGGGAVPAASLADTPKLAGGTAVGGGGGGAPFGPRKNENPV